MIFGECPVEEAEGAILAHSRRLPDRALKKGRALTAADIAELRAAGYERIVCARLGPDDMPEDDAADLLAEAARGENLSRAAAFTGRCNLFAEADGIAVYDSGRLDRFNLVDEAITLGVVPPFQRVARGQMVATLKIIPFALPAARAAAAAAIAGDGGPMIRVAPFRPLRAGLVQSRLEGTKESVLDSTRAVTEARLRAIGSALVHETRRAHTEADIGAGIAEARARGADLVLVSGASAVVDRRDVVPAAIEKAGGEILHFGMPVDPGNLMLVGRLGEVPAIGMPGCARSPKLNGFDWVLQRIAAGVPAGRAEIMRMGTGGLLKDVAARPLPRARARRGAAGGGEDDAKAEAGAEVARAPRIAALLLAAGQSRRMGRDNKLLAGIDGVAMVRRAARNLLASRAASVTVVTGHQRAAVEEALAGLDLAFAHNPDYAEGLSASLRAGLAALPADIDGALVCLGDMPRVTAHAIDRLIAAYDPLEGRAICAPTWRGKRGNPVLWDRRFFEEMAEVAGDTGARHLIGRHDELVVEVEMRDEGVTVDVDTPDALARLAGRGAGAADRKSG